MYSRFSKKEIVALGITGISTLLMVSVLFMVSASTLTTEDFISGLEDAFVVATGSTTTGTSATTTTSTGANGASANADTSSVTETNTDTTSTTQAQAPTAPTRPLQVIPTNTTNSSTPLASPTPVFSNSTPVDITTTAINITSGPALPLSNSSNGAENSTIIGSGLNSASQCTLPAVKILQIEELDTKTIVRWRDVVGAAGYDVLKRSQSGQFVFIERVKQPIYTAHLARGAVKYEDFKVAAVCGDTKSASINTSQVTSVKTGPVQFLLILVLSMNIGAAIMLRKKFKKI